MRRTLKLLMIVCLVVPVAAVLVACGGPKFKNFALEGVYQLQSVSFHGVAFITADFDTNEDGTLAGVNSHGLRKLGFVGAIFYDDLTQEKKDALAAEVWDEIINETRDMLIGLAKKHPLADAEQFALAMDEAMKEAEGSSASVQAAYESAVKGLLERLRDYGVLADNTIKTAMEAIVTDAVIIQASKENWGFENFGKVISDTFASIIEQAGTFTLGDGNYERNGNIITTELWNANRTFAWDRAKGTLVHTTNMSDMPIVLVYKFCVPC